MDEPRAEDEIISGITAAGDPRRGDSRGWTLLPVDTSQGQCSQCGRLHDPDQPHDKQALYYQYAFYAEHDRWATWADAMAHCSQDVRDMWTAALHERGVDD